MERKTLEKQFENIGGRVTIRKGTANRRSMPTRGTVLRLNISKDKKGEHFTMTIDPNVDEKDIIVQVLDVDTKLRQMLLLVKHEDTIERLLVGHDESHWFIAGVTMSRSIKEAFENLRPNAATVAMRRSGVKDKDWRKRKNKGFVRQGEWFFVPVHYEVNKQTIIHKNEPVRRPNGGTAHIIEEVIRSGGDTVYTKGDEILTVEQYEKLDSDKKAHYRQQVLGARVLGRGKVKHPDHKTIELKDWHEVHLSTEVGSDGKWMSTMNAFID